MTYYGGYYGIPLMYLKKEDVLDYAEKQYKSLGYFLIFLPTTFFLVQFIILFLARDYLLSVPFSFGPSFEYLVSFISIIIGINQVVTKRDYTDLQNKIKKYKQGEMINVRDLKPEINKYASTAIFLIMMILVMVGFTWGLMGSTGSL